MNGYVAAETLTADQADRADASSVYDWFDTWLRYHKLLNKHEQWKRDEYNPRTEEGTAYFAVARIDRIRAADVQQWEARTASERLSKRGYREYPDHHIDGILGEIAAIRAERSAERLREMEEQARAETVAYMGRKEAARLRWLKDLSPNERARRIHQFTEDNPGIRLLLESKVGLSFLKSKTANEFIEGLVIEWYGEEVGIFPFKEDDPSWTACFATGRDDRGRYIGPKRIRGQWQPYTLPEPRPE